MPTQQSAKADFALLLPRFQPPGREIARITDHRGPPRARQSALAPKQPAQAGFSPLLQRLQPPGASSADPNPGPPSTPAATPADRNPVASPVSTRRRP
jgi:hypothetical protein